MVVRFCSWPQIAVSWLKVPKPKKRLTFRNFSFGFAFILTAYISWVSVEQANPTDPDPIREIQVPDSKLADWMARVAEFAEKVNWKIQIEAPSDRRAFAMNRLKERAELSPSKFPVLKPLVLVDGYIDSADVFNLPQRYKACVFVRNERVSQGGIILLRNNRIIGCVDVPGLFTCNLMSLFKRNDSLFVTSVKGSGTNLKILHMKILHLNNDRLTEVFSGPFDSTSGANELNRTEREVIINVTPNRSAPILNQLITWKNFQSDTENEEPKGIVKTKRGFRWNSKKQAFELVSEEITRTGDTFSPFND